MATIFDFDKRALKAFVKFYEVAPFKARKATARLLSQFAFGTRQKAIKEIHKTMTVRSPKFVERSIIFKSAKASRIEDQVAITASISRPRFTGWREQEDGLVDQRTRTQSLLARGNNFAKKVKPSVRLKPGRSFIKLGDFGTPSGPNQIPAFIKIVKGKYKNRPFILNKKYKQIKRGVYKFVRNKMQILQNFEAKRRKPKSNPWMTNARRKYFSSTDIDAEWGKAIKFITKKKRF